MSYKYDICIVGGLGHIGLPLGIVFASKGKKVCLQDINKDSADMVSEGKLPFIEYEAEPLLKETLKNKNLSISLDSKSIAEAKNIIIAIGTPVATPVTAAPAAPVAAPAPATADAARALFEATN